MRGSVMTVANISLTEPRAMLRIVMGMCVLAKLMAIYRFSQEVKEITYIDADTEEEAFDLFYSGQHDPEMCKYDMGDIECYRLSERYM